MYLIQIILNLVFFIINNIFSLFGYKTKQMENEYRTHINKVLDTPKNMINKTITNNTQENKQL